MRTRWNDTGFNPFLFLKERGNMNKPPLSWYISINKSRVRKDIEAHPNIKSELGIFYKKFITWDAKQRFIYDEDIYEELKEFREQFINKRLYNIDIKEWQRIRKLVFERDKYKCTYCGKVGGKLEPDHIIPISKGGTNDIINLTTACLKCNRQKKDKTPEEFNQWKIQIFHRGA